MYVRENECVCVGERVHDCVCVCVCERERETEKERENLCPCAYEQVLHNVCERESVYECERVCVHSYVYIEREICLCV